ncbi:MAG: sodium-dependent transporter [Planctomycetes bacterium]|nr:sodium-dependent transporter [Planctomycetota bacterium]
MPEGRGSWGSKLGFLLAASGSAIGLGNIVFFPANAYTYGGGAFYLPYLIALFVIGIPLMILELGIGRMTRRSMPTALKLIGGTRAELAGWFGVLNAGIITMYYITLLGWVVGMLVGAARSLWQHAELAAFTPAPGALTEVGTFFFDMISGWCPVLFVVIVWLLNLLVVVKGARSIEAVVKIFVPLMWLIMIVLIVRGVTMPNGVQGIFFLFTPDVAAMTQPAVWKGAFSQMFFTLSLGFGIMTAYASYLPKKTDDVQSATTISLMNCSFEFIAGLAIFSLLFACAIVPKASTLSMMFWVVPEGITRIPVMAQAFGVLFFALLLVAGLTSSVSLVEAVVISLMDKFALQRRHVLIGVFGVGLTGSIAFALPTVVDTGLDHCGTFGLSLLDLVDHWAFGYGLLVCGLLEVVILGWLFDLRRLVAFINESARFKLGRSFVVLVRYVLPLLILTIVVLSIVEETGGLYGHRMATGSIRGLHIIAFGGWLVLGIGGAILLTLLRRRTPLEEAP